MPEEHNTKFEKHVASRKAGRALALEVVELTEVDKKPEGTKTAFLEQLQLMLVPPELKARRQGE